MGTRSERGQKLDAAVAKHLTPFLDALGFEERAVSGSLRVGVVSRSFARSLPNDVQVDVYIWFEPPDTRISWRVDVLREGYGLPGGPLRIDLPYDSTRPWTHTEEQFQASRSDDNFDRAFEFIGTLLITVADQIGDRVPELRPYIASAKQLEFWRAAPARNAALWENRLVQEGGLDMREAPAKFAFIGANLVLLDCDGQRYTFRFDTSQLDRSASPYVSGFWKTAAGTQSATVLRVGSRRWCFTPEGSLQQAP